MRLFHTASSSGFDGIETLLLTVWIDLFFISDYRKTACYDIDVEVDDSLKTQMNNFLLSTTSQQVMQGSRNVVWSNWIPFTNESWKNSETLKHSVDFDIVSGNFYTWHKNPRDCGDDQSTQKPTWVHARIFQRSTRIPPTMDRIPGARPQKHGGWVQSEHQSATFVQ